MRTQNKTTLTKAFNKFKAEFAKNKDIEISDTVAVRWGPEACIVDHGGGMGFALIYKDMLETKCLQLIKVGHMSCIGLQGIHLFEADMDSILDAIDTAERDGFDNIYIHTVATKTTKAA